MEREFSQVEPWWKNLRPNFDARPTNRLPLIGAQDGKLLAIDDAYCTLLPPKVGTLSEWKFSTLNLRVDRLDAPRSMARQRFKNGRCLVPMAGFYEWPGLTDGSKIRTYIQPAEGGLWLAAGLCNTFRTEDGDEGYSFGILTGPANDVMRRLHNRGGNMHRMPMFVHFEDIDDWMFGAPETARTLLEPIPGDEIAAHVVERNAGNRTEQIRRVNDIPWGELAA